jgi:hypothetical protein
LGYPPALSPLLLLLIAIAGRIVGISSIAILLGVAGIALLA